MNLFIKFAEFIVVKPLMDEFVVVAAHTYTTEQLCRLCPALQTFNGLHGHRCDRPLNRLYNYLTTKLTEKMEENKQQMILEALKEMNINSSNVQIIMGDGTQNVYAENKKNKTAASTEVPALDTSEAWKLWHIAQEHGWVDENRQPTISQPRAAILASVMGSILNIQPLWTSFDELWNFKTDVASLHTHAMGRSYYPKDYKAFNRALSES